MIARPTAEELLAAARDHIAERVVPTIADPRLRFQTLVAVQVLTVVQRELARGAALRSASDGHTRAIVGERADPLDLDPALCAAIREGRFDTDEKALLDGLTASVEAALALWNPAFLERVRTKT